MEDQLICASLLTSHPIDLIIEYLKHSHFLFIKNNPYIARLVEKSFKANHDDYQTVQKRFENCISTFLVEDFIQHIYEEEDTLFSFINSQRASNQINILSDQTLFFIGKEFRSKVCYGHYDESDEMEGIRNITKDYTLHPNAPLKESCIMN